MAAACRAVGGAAGGCAGGRGAQVGAREGAAPASPLAPASAAPPRARSSRSFAARGAPSPPHPRPGGEDMPTQRDSSAMAHPAAGGGGDHSHQVRVKAYYRG